MSAFDRRGVLASLGAAMVSACAPAPVLAAAAAPTVNFVAINVGGVEYYFWPSQMPLADDIHLYSAYFCDADGKEDWTGVFLTPAEAATFCWRDLDRRRVERIERQRVLECDLDRRILTFGPVELAEQSPA